MTQEEEEKMLQLTWENLTDDPGIHDRNAVYTWTDAIAVKIAALNSAVYAGYSDWRLPTKDELISRDDSKDSISSYYWSSSTYAGNPTLAWVVDFSDGYTFADYKTTSNYVRAVRGGA